MQVFIELLAAGCATGVRFPVEWVYFSSPFATDQVRPPIFLFNESRRLFPQWQMSCSLKLTTRFLLPPTLRICGFLF